jgi:hypothetical protein
MLEEKTTADRVAAFSDAVFAVIVTIMVLELRAPDQPAFSALWPLWPTAISYAVRRYQDDEPVDPYRRPLMTTWGGTARASSWWGGSPSRASRTAWA